MKKIILIFIFILAFILRFWQLGESPPSLDWDEASLGYNAYSLLKTGKDEYGNPWPTSIRSFNDYKPALYTYLTTLPVYIFGLNEFSTRFISAFFGTLAVLVGYFLIKELFPKKSFLFFVFCFLFFAVSPWHLQFSRIAFEANIALFFFLTGIWLFLKGLKAGKFFALSILSFALSVYSYHSPRLVLPILFLGMIMIFKKEIKSHIIWFVTSLVIFGLLVWPIVAQFKSETLARFGSVTVINPSEKLETSIEAIEFDQKRGDILGKLMHNRRIIYAREILAGYFDHFNFDFLFTAGDAPGRHHPAGMGMLYFWDLPFILIGVYYLLKDRSKQVYFLLWWFTAAPLASSIASGTPHAVRALLYLPTYQIFVAFGVVEFMQFIKKFTLKESLRNTFQVAEWIHPEDSSRGTPGRWILSQTIIFLPFTFFIFNFFYYLHMYYIHTPNEYSQWWQYGYKEVVEEVGKIEKYYDKIIVTYAYDQPYIFFLFYQQIDPSWYQKNWGGGEVKRAERRFGKYEFRHLDWEKDGKLSNVLLVGTPGEIPADASGQLTQIYFLDGSVAFRIVGK